MFSLVIFLLEHYAFTSSSFYTLLKLCLIFFFSSIYHFVLCILFSLNCTFLNVFIFDDLMISFFLYSLFFLSSSIFFIPHVLDSFTMLSFLLVSFSLCIVISSSFTSLRSFHLSSIRQIPLFASMCACLRRRGSTRASGGNILFIPLCLSSLNSAARLPLVFSSSSL